MTLEAVNNRQKKEKTSSTEKSLNGLLLKIKDQPTPHDSTYIDTYIHTYIHRCIDTYINTYIHACMHACMHTYKHKLYFSSNLRVAIIKANFSEKTITKITKYTTTY